MCRVRRSWPHSKYDGAAMPSYAAFILLLFSSLVLPGLAWGQSVAPTRVEIDLSISGEVTLTLKSSRAKVQALELMVLPYPGETLERGERIQVVPLQLLLPAGESRQVRVRWQGESQLPNSESFLLAIEELPVEVGSRDSKASSSEVRLLSRLLLPLHVFSTGQPVLNSDIVNSDGAKVLRLENRGRKYASLANYELHMPHAHLAVLAGLDVARVIRRDAILPGQRVEIPLAALGLDSQAAGSISLARK